jgi:hypothetical protein
VNLCVLKISRPHQDTASIGLIRADAHFQDMRGRISLVSQEFLIQINVGMDGVLIRQTVITVMGKHRESDIPPLGRRFKLCATLF